MGLGKEKLGVNAILSDNIKKHKNLFGEGNGNPLQYSCLANPMDGGAW